MATKTATKKRGGKVIKASRGVRTGSLSSRGKAVKPRISQQPRIRRERPTPAVALPIDGI